jgi:hypothetical protein
MGWIWPLAAPPLLPDAPGQFGATRRLDRHTGVDLYCEPGTTVLAVEGGVVASIVPFTGAHADSAWWNETWAVLVAGVSGVVVYGEISTQHKVGAEIKQGDSVGHVIPVLKKFKNRPMVMLHLELMDQVREPYWWPLDEPQPAHLLDPTSFLPDAPRFDLAAYDRRSFLVQEVL